MMRRNASFMAALALAAISLSSSAVANDETIERAMRDEMARSIESLRLENLERPYFIEYRIDDARQQVVTASFGALVQSFPRRTRTLTVDVRVGDHNLDNSEFLSTDLFSRGSFFEPRQLPLEDDYFVLRHDMWAATDEAYKIGLEVLTKKRAHRENRIADKSIPDFSREEPHVSKGDPISYKIDAPKWEKRIRDASAIFRDFPKIDESKVELRVQHLVRHYINSEGGQYRRTEPCAILYATARTYSDDGVLLKDFVRFVASLPGDLPNEKEFEDAVRELATELTALRSAPEIENYTGPVLFTGMAVADLVVEAVGRQLIGQRVPEADMPQLAQMMPSPKLADQVGKRVTSEILTVYDDPTTAVFGGTKLAGAFAVDDQGMPARKVTLIEAGAVKSLLMSRRPHADIPQSNGHARMPFSGVIGSDVTIGNLFVESSKSMPADQLKNQLMTICKDEGLEFGLIIRKLDDAALTGIEMDSESMMAMFQRQGEGGIGLGAPIVAYKVYAADGREELVRGLAPLSIGMRALRDIVAVGDASAAYNQLVSPGGQMFTGMGLLSGDGAEGFRISLVVPAAVVTPSILFEEFDLKRDTASKQKPTVLAHPFFE